MSYRASHRFARIAPRKARLAADMIRGMPIDEAMTALEFNKKRSCWYLKAVLKSAIANAENNAGADVDELKVVEVQVNEGPTMKRIRARAKGRASRILKRTSHICVTVAER